MDENGLKLAIKTAGGQVALASALGVTQQLISHWLRSNTPIPAKRVVAIEAATGVPRSVLRPDLWPPAARTEPGAAA